MFVNETLKTHFETSSTVKLQSLVLAEWNMNMPDNIFQLGNYRYRPTGTDVQLRNLPTQFDEFDVGNYYTGATDADVVVDGGYDTGDTPQKFTLNKDKMKMIYSLEECVKPFRPRSGINKLLYINGKYLPNAGSEMARRPRYYMASKYDQFKYWTSYRTENNIEQGIANNIVNGLYYINDAVPFVVYKNKVPANRLVVKMQTNVGDVDLGFFNNGAASIPDPLYGDTNKTIPKRWSIQYLLDNNWVNAITFNESSLRADGSPIVGSDGYLELHYGLVIPEKYASIFTFADQLSSTMFLPEASSEGYSYLVIDTENTKGTFYIWTNGAYETFTPEYGWTVGDETISLNTPFIKDVTNPASFIENNQTTYREFQYVQGIRIVAETMNKFDSTFDLIEMSPRLIVDISDKTIDFKINKILSDIGITSLPVGQLLASTGQLSIFDNDRAFNINNSSSIISQYIRKNIKFSFYEIVNDVDSYSYCIPIKTLYSEGFPQTDVSGATLSLQLRDFYFYLESIPAPRLLLTQTSLSVAISILLDYIGLSNYSFKRVAGETDPVIPYFFIAPDQNVAQVLNQLAISTQTAMFFDEYNNFIVMSKNYLVPSETERTTDFVLVGTNNQSQNGVVKNESTGNLPNILSISSDDNRIYNDGKINYTMRYIQRSYGTIRQASLVDADKTWIYKPALLWEVAGTDATKTINELASKQGSYVLGAMPINSDISDAVPNVENHILKNNILDLGENVYWLTRYQGYLYSNGEIIKYDAAQFNITGVGNVWISSNQEYQQYFASLPFNGKIYPTGLIRIFSTPYYETVNGITRLKNGEVFEHGRGQFGTPITTHTAEINTRWSDNTYIRGCEMQTKYLFTTALDEDVQSSLPETELGLAGSNNSKAALTTRNGIIKNFMSTNYLTETDVNNLKTTQTGTIQSSALVMNGPSFTTEEKPINLVSYVYKNLDNAYRHFGTRMRIVGKVENNINRSQTPIGSTTFYQVPNTLTQQNISIGGGSGGLAVLLNPETNNGYYFEIVALTENNVQSYLKLDTQGNSAISLNNVVFYKIKKNKADSTAIPIKLWGGLTQVLVDDGRFTGQYRMAGEENPTVYDLSVEYQDIGKIRRFYLYINNKLIKVVDDTDPLPIYNNMAPFVRGSSRVMFENIYALAENYTQNSVFTVGETLSNVFGEKDIDANEAFRKYAMSGIIQSTYLSGIGTQESPRYNMYFEEFGSIMRECAYFDVRYDRAYPALYAQISPTFNRIKGYTVSGFQADSYGAEFLIFNATDKALTLDETSGNYLRIQGITFTQNTTHELTVDEFFKKRSTLLEPELSGNPQISSPIVEDEKYNNVKLSRITYGKNEFTIDSPYIQTQDDAEALMNWIINKVMVPKKSVGVKVFATPMLQLGDIVSIDYKDSTGIDVVAPTTSRFVIYNIEYSKSLSGPQMTLYLSEV